MIDDDDGWKFDPDDADEPLPDTKLAVLEYREEMGMWYLLMPRLSAFLTRRQVLALWESLDETHRTGNDTGADSEDVLTMYADIEYIAISDNQTGATVMLTLDPDGLVYGHLRAALRQWHQDNN